LLLLKNLAMHLLFWYAYEKEQKATEPQTTLQATHPRKTIRFLTKEKGRASSLSLAANSLGGY
jgi:hypothetical protein